MKWIGLTGGIATGKTSVANILREQGFPVVDADSLVHEAMKKDSQVYKQVLDHFGTSVLDVDHEIDRRQLGQIVFSNREQLDKLESIIHPKVQALTAEKRNEFEKRGFELAFYDVPLLFEKELQDNFDSTVLVYATPEQQRQRMQERNKWSEEEIEKRLQSQIKIDEKRDMADFVIDNSKGLVELKKQVQKLVAELKAPA